LLQRRQAVGGGELEEVQGQQGAQRQREWHQRWIDGLRPGGHAAGEDDDRGVRRAHEVEQHGRLQVQHRARRGLLQDRFNRGQHGSIYRLVVDRRTVYRLSGEKGKKSVRLSWLRNRDPG
jgi:hypothetical protein